MASPHAGIRASDADRARVVTLLQRHYEAGRLAVEELEERSRQAYASRTLGELDALMADLPPEPEPTPDEPAPAAPARWPAAWSRGFGRYAAVMVLLVAIWALSGRGYFWPAWPMLGWGAAILMRASRGSWRSRYPGARPLRYRRRHRFSGW